MTISYALQPNGLLSMFNGPTGYFLAFNLEPEEAHKLGLAHGMQESEVSKALDAGIKDRVHADIDQPFGTRRWNELICSIEKDRGPDVALLALQSANTADYSVPDKIRARFGLATATSPALGRETPNGFLPLYFIKGDDEQGLVHFRDDWSERCSFQRTENGEFILWKLDEDLKFISQFDITGMQFEILFPLRGDTKIRTEFEEWFFRTYPDTPKPGTPGALSM